MNWESKAKTPKSQIFVCNKCGGKAYFPQPNNQRKENKTKDRVCGYMFCPNCGEAVDNKTPEINTVMSGLEGLTWDDWHEYHSDSEVKNIANAALEFLKKQQEVVRCKDCCHRHMDVCINEDGKCFHSYVPDNWFCGDGERNLP